MSCRVSTAGFLLLALTGLVSVRAENLEIFAWRQPITGAVVSGQVYRLTLPPDLLARCRAFPADMRIVDERQMVWPFFVLPPSAVADESAMQATGGTNNLSPVLVFEALGGQHPQLWHGADRVPLPRYDLLRRTSAERIVLAPVLGLGQARYNPLKVASGLVHYGRTMAWLAALSVGALSLVAALRFLRGRG